MARKIPQDELSSRSDTSESEASDHGGSANKHNLAEPAALGVQEEFHTDSGSSNEDDDDGESEDEPCTPEDDEIAPLGMAGDPPLLPPELLKPLLSPAISAQPVTEIPWTQLTRTQKKTRRNHERAAKKKVWDELRRNAKGTGVLEAGKAAQAKRLLARSDRVRAGRVEKKSKPVVSGRQQLLETRKRARQESDMTAKPTKKQKKG